jgi:hypothetical protein
MATRKHYQATLTDQAAELSHSIVFAWNSATRAAESAVREVARREGQMYSRGVAAGTVGQSRSTVWTGDRTGRILVATVTAL